MSSTTGETTASSYLTTSNRGNKEKGDVVVSVERYIPMPMSLWALRHKYPSVMRSVLLQCVRCHRWVAQPVAKQVPDVVRTCQLRPGLVAEKSQPSRHMGTHAEEEEEEEEEEWRSPRLRQHYEKVVNVVKPTKNSDAPKEMNPYYIPNPANFTCQWTYCALEDTWADLREQWLGELYAAMEESAGGCGGRAASKQHSPQSRKERLNEKLASELQGRRSERLARKPYNGLDMKLENDEVNGSATESHTSGGRISRHVNTLIHNDEAVVASFCWVTCDACGKLRRVYQPFPGGAPFVCALALNIGSCSVPEYEGLKSFFSNARNHSSADGSGGGGRYGTIIGDEALCNAIVGECTTSSNSVSSSASTTTAIFCGATTNTNSNNNNTNTSSGVKATSPTRGRRGSRGTSAITSSSSVPVRSGASVRSVLPLLGELTCALRKRALGAFAKNITTIPDEVREKRETVVRDSLVVAEEDNSKREESSTRAEQMYPHEPENTIITTTTNNNNSSDSNDNKLKRENDGETHEDRNGTLEVGGKSEVTRNPGGEEVPRRRQRLGCPPRFPPFKPKEYTCEDARMRSDVSSNNYYNNNNDPMSAAVDAERCTTQEGATAVKTGAAAKDAREIHGSSSLRVTLMKREVSPPASKVPPTAVVEDSSPPKTHEKKRGRPPAMESVKKNKKNNNDDDNSNTTKKSGSNNKVKRENSHGIVRRGRKPRREEDDDADAKMNEKEEMEIIHWVCCDACEKWRVVPQKIPEETDYWECEMREDGTTCDDTDDEIRMNRRKKRGRNPKNASKLNGG